MSTETAAGRTPRTTPRRGRIKCVVWDLDDTVWDGVLLEDGEVTVRPAVVAEIRRLDGLGILHSVASRNDHEAAMARLRAAGLDDYFLHPQIGWNPKSASVAEVAKALNIGLDTIAFVDDQPFEREEVAHALPQILTVDAADIHTALRTEEFRPRFVTDESRTRRAMYRSAIERDQVEREYTGTSEEFLATLDMVFTIAPARPGDLQRAEELTVRTNQLNATGRTYSYDELDALRRSDDHLLLVAGLTDKYGSYGTIGLALVEKGRPAWHLRMMLMSCRVMSRGVGTVLLNHVMGLAKADGATLRADFVETGRNRVMYVTYAFAGFTEAQRDGDRIVLESRLDEIQPPPAYLTLDIA
ncbi:HAD-IIIC family phosphatase [Streptantibioticus cattleyicolor]|uniref:FkbH like protein n=1 Tax=Streptantibioticus cattleyicolor (strain ATCC 35852 / DSM 46488 / JCM 4925 / NBRC 14057 / NRRL 8057) TaxID=1003195 RepID=F8JL84_STREN|nr:HAD-IIIC family phosphatase [Streptantibioticus cattleyicolor]AEW99630.1 FkbH like protein [Streptantibioticus cattleyicolor NRRL 8057 = DSM 46488]CCB71333.1 Subfamily IIIC HAD-superfamily phosphatase [Streptantibioticus cattleyicolor NRRL 8057 = DSM 46488]